MALRILSGKAVVQFMALQILSSSSVYTVSEIKQENPVSSLVLHE